VTTAFLHALDVLRHGASDGRAVSSWSCGSWSMGASISASDIPSSDLVPGPDGPTDGRVVCDACERALGRRGRMRSAEQ